MGKLNIAHHKSYHPYRSDNIARVRRDEEEARLKEQVDEGRMLLADAESRMQLLRSRAGLNTSSDKKALKRAEERELLERATAPRESSETKNRQGHFNFFEDLEQNAMASTLSKSLALEKLAKGKGKAAEETEKGIPLAPSKKDLKPWYVASRSRLGSDDADEGNGDAEGDEESEKARIKRSKELSRKSFSDPLTSINRELASKYPSRPSSISTSRQSSRLSHNAAPSSTSLTAPGHSIREGDPHTSTRLTRESSERLRALELIRRKKREAAMATPSTVRDGGEGGYSNQFNRREVDEAHKRRDGGWGRDRDWNGDRDRDRGRDIGKGRRDVRQRGW